MFIVRRRLMKSFFDGFLVSISLLGTDVGYLKKILTFNSLASFADSHDLELPGSDSSLIGKKQYYGDSQESRNRSLKYSEN